MALSSELISNLVKVTSNRGRDNQDYTVYGTVTTDGDRNYVKMDGSDLSTPIETTVEINEGDRVIVEVKNHTATVTGNTTNPSIGTVTADNLRSSITQTASEIRSEVADDVNNLSSTISQTATEIRSEVTDQVNGLNSKITQTANSISSVVSKQDEFSEFQQTVEGFSFMNKGGTVKISGGDVNLTGAIKFSDLSDSSTVQSQINTANSNASSAKTTANNAADTAEDVLTTVNGITITEDSKTYIDGEMIYSGSVYADAIHLGGALTVYKTLYGNTAGGTLGYDSGFSSESGIGIRASDSDGPQVVCTNRAARLSYGTTVQFLASDDCATIKAGNASIYLSDQTNYGCLEPTTKYDANTNDYPMHLGRAAHRWHSIYLENGEIQVSDRNMKNSIEDLPTKYLTLFDGLRPRIFKMNNGTSDRYHVGYIAQEVEEAMNAAGIDSQEFAGFIRDKDEEGNDILMLRYGEFDAIYSAKVKQLEKQNADLESRIEKLEKLLTENT